MPTETSPTVNEAILMAGISDMHNCVSCNELCNCAKDVCICCEECQEWYFRHDIAPPKKGECIWLGADEDICYLHGSECPGLAGGSHD